MRAFLVSLAVLLSVANVPSALASPEGQMNFALQVSLAPVWFDPAETTSTSVPFIVLYAVHDALVKPMPGQPMAPSLAESWTVSRDGLVYEFVLRRGVKFHNGEPVTVEDVKFSFERYRGTAASAFKARIAAVEVIDAQRVRFRLKQPWPDFMTYYGTPATGEGGRRRVQASAGRGGALQVRRIQPGCRARARGERAVLAQDTDRQDAGLSGRPRLVHPTGHAEAWRGGRGLHVPRGSG